MGAAEWAFSARQTESETIIRAASAPPGVLVLAGGVGAGKTRLARFAAGWARRHGRPVSWIQANASLSTIPWGALEPADEPGLPPHLLLQRTVARLAARGTPAAPAMVVCDDAHHLDDRSAAAVLELARLRRVHLVLTVRDGLPLPDAIRVLAADPATTTVRVEHLGGDAVASVLERVLGAKARRSTVEQILALTGGNFLYLFELVRGELAEGRLRLVDGAWQWARDTTLPQGLSNTISARFAGMPGEEARLMALVAAGGPLPCRVYERLAPLAVIEAAEGLGLVRTSEVAGEVVLDVGHPLYGEVARARTGLRLRRHLSGLLVEAWDRSDAETGVQPGIRRVLRSALLRLDSDLAPEFEPLSGAAGAALAVTDLALAERLCTAADAIRPDPANLLALAFARSWQAKGPETAEVLDRLDALTAPAVSTPSIIARAGNLFWPLRDPDAAVALLSRALESRDGDGAADLRAMRATLRVFSGAIRDARIDLPGEGPGVPSSGEGPDARVDRPAEDPDAPSPLATAFLAWAEVGVHAVSGSSDRLGDAAERGYSRAVAENAATLRLGIAEMHLVGVRLAGRVAEATQVARRFSIEAAWSGGVGSMLERRLAGLAALVDGRIDESIELLTESAAELAPLAPNGWLFRCTVDLAQALALAGKGPAARAMLVRARAEQHPAFAFMSPEVEIAEALVLAAEGRLAEAIAVAEDAAARARGLGELGYEVLALGYATQLGSSAGAARLAELAGLVDGPRVRIAAAHAAALSAGDATRLDAVAGEWEALGERVAALDAASQAAIAAAARGDGRTARRHAARARSLSRWAAGARTSAFIRVGLPPTLTAREVEVLRLAGAGHPNKSIALALGISLRTVEGHVYRATAKLGGAARGSLGDYLGPES